jgi:hypothetical protein
MPFRDKDEKDTDELQRDLTTAIPISEFEQYVSCNLPYNGTVFGVGRIEYYSLAGDPILLQDMEDDQLNGKTGFVLTDTQKDPWIWGGVAWGGFSLYKSFKAFDKANPFYYRNSRGKSVSMKMLDKNPKTGRYYPGYQGHKYGQRYALQEAAKLSKVANRISYVSLVIPVAHTFYAGEVNTEDTVDFIFAAVNFIPGYGWAISGVYMVADSVCVLITGEKIATHGKEKANDVYNQLFTKWVQFNQELKNWVNGFSFGFYYLP